MDIPIPSLLLALGGKTLLNWAVVLAQRRHMGRSFLGTFCVSLAMADALLFLSISTIFLLGDLRVLGLRITRHHICALVHVACLAYGLLHWPILLLAGLDYCCTLPPRPRPLGWVRVCVYPSAACLIWAAALLHVLGGQPPRLDSRRGSHLLLRQCRVSRGPQSMQVCAALLLLVAGAVLCCCAKFTLCGNAGGDGSRRGASAHVWHALYRNLASFLSAWHAFVILLVALLLLRVEVPGFLDMNVPWLCFINSFLICGVSTWRPPGYPREGVFPAFPDGFCDWSSLRSMSLEEDAGAASLECDRCSREQEF